MLNNVIINSLIQRGLKKTKQAKINLIEALHLIHKMTKCSKIILPLYVEQVMSH